MRLAAAVIAAVALMALAAAAPASGAVHLSQVGTFSSPVYVTAPPGDPDRVMVVEKAGRIQEVLDGTEQPTPFLDISSLVQNTYAEKGLLSMAFAPDYATSGRFYVYYTAPKSGDSNGDVLTIEAFKRSANNPNVADPSSGRMLQQIPHPGQPNHNGGLLQFGSDGQLYAGVGDGGGSDDHGSGRPPNNAQNTGVDLGKILRIDPSSGSSTIYAYGLRNPWRFSFDPATGALVIADVGQNTWEEIDYAGAGVNAGLLDYGWPCYEGNVQDTNASPNCTLSNAVFPVLVKNHTSDGFCAIVGGYVVRDPALGSLDGKYIYGDDCATAIRSVTLPGAGDDADTGMSVSQLTSFGEDSCGHLYAASLTGPVYRIDGDTFTPCPPGQTTIQPPGTGTGGNPGHPPTPPVIGLSARRLQRILRQKGVRIALSCNEVCGATVSGLLRIAHSKRVYTLKGITRELGAGRRAKLTLRASKRALSAIRAALGHHRRVSVALRVVARNSSGAQSTRTKSVFAKR